MTSPVPQSMFDALDHYLMGNTYAVSLALDMIFLAHKIDDLVDRDIEISVDDIKLVFRKVFVDLPQNQFYQVWRVQLEPLITNAYMNWLDSTTLEQGDKDDRCIGFQIRNDVLKIVRYMLLLIGGPEWAQDMGPSFWKQFWGLKEQEYLDYLEEAIQ